MSLFRKKTPPVIGIDISSTAVKLIELREQGGAYRIESYAVQPLPPNAVAEKNINNVEAVSEAIRAGVKKAGTRLRAAAVAVPGSSAISRNLTMTGGLKESELEAQVSLQADQYVPYPLEEVNLDFQVLGPVNNGQEVEVLLVASRSENVEIRVDALEAAGLKAQIVDVESYALEQAFHAMTSHLTGASEQTVAVVDIGSTMTSLTVFEHGRIVYTRDQTFGGKQLTEDVMRRFGLSFEEAGRAKRQGGLPDNYNDDSLMPFMESMTQQVNRSLQFFFGSSQHDSVDRILLGGGCANIHGAAEMIEEATGAETTVANPFASMSVAPRVKRDKLADDAPTMIIACGLALRSFD